MADLAALQKIAEAGFADIVIGTRIVDAKLRVLFTDYRHDNMPHRKWASTKTFPQHYHDGSADNVSESQLSVHPETALREFLTFVRHQISSQHPDKPPGP